MPESEKFSYLDLYIPLPLFHLIQARRPTVFPKTSRGCPFIATIAPTTDHPQPPWPPSQQELLRSVEYQSKVFLLGDRSESVSTSTIRISISLTFVSSRKSVLHPGQRIHADKTVRPQQHPHLTVSPVKLGVSRKCISTGRAGTGPTGRDNRLPLCLSMAPYRPIALL